MRIYNLLLPLIIVITIAGCQTEETEKIEKFEIIRDIEFDVGFNYSRRFSGTYFDKKDSVEFVYFANPVSGRHIKFFDLLGNLHDTVPLIEAMRNVIEIDGISIVSLDTIVISCYYSGRLLFVNNDGECWHKIDLNDAINTDDEEKYYFASSFNSGMWANSDIILLESTPSGKRAQNSLVGDKFLDYFYKKDYESAYFLKISDYLSESPEFTFGLDGFFKNIYDSAFTAPGPFFIYPREYVFVFHNVTDLIFKVDVNTLSIIETIQVESRDSDIGWIHRRGTAEKLDSDRDNYAIIDLQYNSIDDEYYVFLNHGGNRGINNNFSIIILDSIFNKRDEIAFHDEIYSYYHSKMTREGLIIPYFPEHIKDYEYGKAVYSVFKFN